MASKLHVWTDGCSWVIAESAEDAAVLALEKHGEYAEDYPNLAAEFRALPDDKQLAVEAYNDDDGVLVESTAMLRTCAQWVAAEGRGYLCGGEDSP